MEKSTEKKIINTYKIKDFYNWMESSQEAKIVKLKLGPNQLFDLQSHKSPKGYKWHNAQYESFTTVIDHFIEASEDLKIKYMCGELGRNTSIYNCYPESNDYAYWLYKAMKMYWLYESIKNDCQHAPIQMHKFRNGYRFHPGSDKVNALYLLGKLNNLHTDVFYIWYKTLDLDFDKLGYDYEVVETASDFADMFVKWSHDSFKIISGQTIIHPSYDYKKSDEHLEVSSYYAAESLRWDCTEKLNDKLPYHIHHISYNDNIHHIGIDLYIDMIMHFKHTEDRFILPNGISFIKKYTGSEWQPYCWIPECDGDEYF
tara:strand:+ start:173 stop:1114 length:942 start_codon:yes stop_codon:yes gene_type:complete